MLPAAPMPPPATSDPVVGEMEALAFVVMIAPGIVTAPVDALFCTTLLMYAPVGCGVLAVQPFTPTCRGEAAACVPPNAIVLVTATLGE